ncbi:hypothetical protein J2Z66_006283 [Paenibacillus eucommiae]|uniref:Uncharacterized protein n=1 Tax=Paenibacillus eucommiae TaxID=1355755 RepID=A0ABS4J477_9BACL|nr:hypothetical protein [Paenibacillus eucommiae]MBP1994644.1 hypothetical protein [Paenibacillus eucommiae]
MPLSADRLTTAVPEHFTAVPLTGPSSLLHDHPGIVNNCISFQITNRSKHLKGELAHGGFRLEVFREATERNS